MSVSARNTAGSHSGPRRSSARASVPRKNSDSASAIVNENSPASVLVSVAAHDVEVERHGRVAAVLEEQEAGGGDARTAARPAAARGCRGRTRTRRSAAATGPSAVTSLNAMLYGSTTSRSDDQQRREREVELPGGEARVEVVRPARDPPRQQVVDQEVGEPDVRAGVAAGDGGVAQHERRPELDEDVDAAGRDDRQADPLLEPVVPVTRRGATGAARRIAGVVPLGRLAVADSSARARRRARARRSRRARDHPASMPGVIACITRAERAPRCVSRRGRAPARARAGPGRRPSPTSAPRTDRTGGTSGRARRPAADLDHAAFEHREQCIGTSQSSARTGHRQERRRNLSASVDGARANRTNRAKCSVREEERRR